MCRFKAVHDQPKSSGADWHSVKMSEAFEGNSSTENSLVLCCLPFALRRSYHPSVSQSFLFNSILLRAQHGKYPVELGTSFRFMALSIHKHRLRTCPEAVEQLWPPTRTDRTPPIRPFFHSFVRLLRTTCRADFRISSLSSATPRTG